MSLSNPQPQPNNTINSELYDKIAAICNRQYDKEITIAEAIEQTVALFQAQQQQLLTELKNEAVFVTYKADDGHGLAVPVAVIESRLAKSQPNTPNHLPSDKEVNGIEQKLEGEVMRDQKIKEAFIAYLQDSGSERFFQALTNFTQLPYIGVADSPDGSNFRDLWHVEADAQINWKAAPKQTNDGGK